MSHGKIYANRGVARNKKPLRNIQYRFENAKPENDEERFLLLWRYEGRSPWCFVGPKSPEFIKGILSPKQWCRFRQGVREFTIQRRIDGHNVPIQKPVKT